MTNDPPQAPAAVPAATQAVTVVQPAEPRLAVNLDTVEAWALAFVAVAGAIAAAYKLLTREIARDIKDVDRRVADVDHKLGNVRGRVDALEHAREGDIARIVKLETSLNGLERGQDRIEKTINERFDTLAVSIREIRHVSPR